MEFLKCNKIKFIKSYMEFVKNSAKKINLNVWIFYNNIFHYVNCIFYLGMNINFRIGMSSEQFSLHMSYNYVHFGLYLEKLYSSNCWPNIYWYDLLVYYHFLYTIAFFTNSELFRHLKFSNSISCLIKVRTFNTIV